jgi:hypothetical protein
MMKVHRTDIYLAMAVLTLKQVVAMATTVQQQEETS